MAAPSEFGFSIRDIAIGKSSSAYLVCGIDSETAKRIPISRAFRSNGDWQGIDVPFVSTSVCVLDEDEETALLMGVGGYILSWNSRGVSEDIIDDSDQGPHHYGDLSEIRNIDGNAYVVGMARTVYRRERSGAWTRLDNGVRSADDDDSDAGFNSIDGFGCSELYAVGWDGEIWSFDGKNWAQQDSGTNLILSRVVCGGDGVVYVCGQKGTILRGRRNVWENIENDVTKQHFWGATWFRDKLYLATTKSLYVLEDREVKAIEFSSQRDISLPKNLGFYRLDSNEKVMWSAGQKMLLYTYDASTWAESSYM